MPGLSRKTLVFLSLLVLLSGVRAFAADDDMDESGPEAKARQAHQLASSDMMYQNEEWKAIYYQNQEIIQLLRQIRDTLNVIKVNDGPAAAKEEKA